MAQNNTLNEQNSLIILVNEYNQKREQSLSAVQKHMKPRAYHLTDAEHCRVSRRSERNGYGFTLGQLAAMSLRHAAGDERDKAIVEEQLADVNYHRYCALLNQGRYADYEAEAYRDYGVPRRRLASFASVEPLAV